MSLVHVKCVICGHRWSAPLTREMPMCPLCMGLVTVDRVETKAAKPTDKSKAEGT